LSGVHKACEVAVLDSAGCDGCTWAAEGGGKVGGKVGGHEGAGWEGGGGEDVFEGVAGKNQCGGGGGGGCGGSSSSSSNDSAVFVERIFEKKQKFTVFNSLKKTKHNTKTVQKCFTHTQQLQRTNTHSDSEAPTICDM